MNEHLPVEAAWAFVDFIGPVIWWSKAIAALIIGIVLQLMPQPLIRSGDVPGLSKAEWFAVIWSRAGVFIGAMILALSVITPINAFGPLGDLLFYPSMAVNALCLFWCNRKAILGHLRRNRAPETTLLRSFFIAGTSTVRRSQD